MILISSQPGGNNVFEAPSIVGEGGENQHPTSTASVALGGGQRATSAGSNGDLILGILVGNVCHVENTSGAEGLTVGNRILAQHLL